MPEQKFLVPCFSIPTENVNPPFDEMIHQLQTLEIHAPPYLKVGEPEMYVVRHCLDGWDTALHWAAKLKWSTNHKIPGGQKHSRAAKPMGIILACEIELCIQCHAGLGYKATGYNDASIWFGAVWEEHVKNNLNNLFKLTIHGSGKKGAVFNFRHNVLAVLKEDKNPFNPEDQPHMHHLIECSLNLAKRSDVFRKKYWVPYVRALTACATQVDHNPNGYYQVLTARLTPKMGKTFLQICKPVGKGKGERILFEKEVVAETLTQ